MRHFLEIDELSPGELERVLELSSAPDPGRVLEGRGAALVFEKPSNRTRNSMEMAVFQLGGHPVYLTDPEMAIDRRESARDVIRVLAGYHAVVAARVFDHGVLERMAEPDAVPVVNLLSDRAHPMQALADLLTIRQVFGGFDDLTVTYVGDANNVWRSLALGCAIAGIDTRIATPAGYGPTPGDLARIAELGGRVEVLEDPHAAVRGADVVYTDVWTSMGQEEERQARLDDFAGFTVDASLMAEASDRAVFLHCLPAHRGEEVTDEVMESGSSRVWTQAHNRMHSARGLLAWLLGPGPDSED